MRIDLVTPGVWVEIREGLKAGDGSVKNAVQFSVQDGRIVQDGGITDTLRKALLARIITGWSFADQGIPIPALHGDIDTREGMAAAMSVIDKQLDMDDFNELSEHPEIEARLQKVTWRNPNQNRPSSTA